MINIISGCAASTKVFGAGKVLTNLLKGLDRIGYPYVLNRDLNAARRLWVHDDVDALRYLRYSRSLKVLGPNLCVLPGDIPPTVDLRDVLFLHPCDWTRQVWFRAGFNACPIDVWPVGIDTDTFCPPPGGQPRKRVMVYHKKRNPRDLEAIFGVLHQLHLPYSIIIYSEYEEAEYLEALRETSFIIWHGGHESQGIALQEALACDIPILVCDATRLSQGRDTYRFGTEHDAVTITSAPYFDSSCGVKITDWSRLQSAVEYMVDNLDRFAPRAFILRNLSLERQARAFVACWDRWGLTFEEGLGETCRSDRTWSAPLAARVRAKVGRILGRMLLKRGKAAASAVIPARV